MPSIDENIATWNAASSWQGGGEEWTGPWGGSEAQWWGSLLPRLHAFLPAPCILELGPGHGRWTEYLKHHCDQLILVDVAEACIDACKQRFAAEQHITYHVNDGKSFPAVPDRSVDLAFSFDSLVHAEADVLISYAAELSRALKPHGIGFIHHSNMRELRIGAAIARAVPPRWRLPLTVRGVLVNVFGWRAASTSGDWFREVCAQVGLSCIAQEKVCWQFGRYLTDAITVVTPRGSRWERPCVTFDNTRFMEEGAIVGDVAKLYSDSGFLTKTKA